MTVITDAICVCNLNKNKILASVGNELHFYYKNTETEKTENVVFPIKTRDKIHGIVFREINIHNYLILIQSGKEIILLRLNNNIFEEVSKTKLNDWISSCKFLLSDNQFCLITCKNVAVSIEYNLCTKEQRIVNRTSCEDNPTLYCSLIENNIWNDLIVLSGTALGEILIWKPSEKTLNDKGKIINRLNGHRGSIFSICCDFNLRLITTTSDDRSVKFWDIIDEKWNLKVKKIVFGHVARVFKSKIICENKQIYILSIGEDSNLCVWDIEGNLLLKKLLHYGSTIWNLDYDTLQKIIYTSGADGNIKSINIHDILEGKLSKTTEIIIDNLEIKEYLSKVKFLENGIIIGLTNFNKFLYFHEKNQKWLEINKNLNKICVLETNKNIIVLGGFQKMYVYKYLQETNDFKLMHEKFIMNSMIRSFHFLADEKYIICDDLGNCLLLDYNFNIENSFTLPKCKEKWTTSACKYNNSFLLADRNGNLLLISLENNKMVLKYTLKRVHGCLGITKINLITNNQEFILIKTSGHDGTIKTIEINKETNFMQIVFTEKTSILWIENFFNDNVMKKSNYIIGFNDNYFIIENKLNNFNYKINCGGGHRYWDIKFFEEHFLFIFIRNKKLIKIFINNNVNNNMLNIKQNNWHIKSCNTVSSILLNNAQYVVSGGDDNMLKIHKLLTENNTKSRLHSISDIILHISNVKNICTEILNENQCLVVSVGGRAQIVVTEITVNKECGVTLKEKLNFMLKPTDYERKRLGLNQLIDFDPETRFMCMQFIKTDQNCFKVLIGCSDGFIRVFDYDYTCNVLVLKGAVFYGRCLLNIHCFHDNQIILTMATDGYLCFWNIEGFLATKKPFYQIKNHQNGVNCYDLITINNNHYKICTGGDDQSVVLTEFKIIINNTCDYSIYLINTIRNDKLHSAQVTGIKFLNTKSLVTTGVDQNVYELDINLNIINKYFSSISDIKGVNLVKSIADENYFKIIVYGTGVQIF